MTVSRRTVLVLAAVVLLAAAVSQLRAPSARPDAPRTEPVAVAQDVCLAAPTSSQAGAVVRTYLTVAAPDGIAAGAGTDGSLRVGRLDKDDALLPSSDRRGAALSLPSDQVVVTRADGARAQGLTVDTYTVSGRTSDFGVSSGGCAPLGVEAWFVGAASAAGRDAVVHLANPTPTSATVDVEVYSSRGRVDAPSATGVVVGPRSLVRLPLSQVAPGAGEVALHVRARAGRVAVGVRETEVRGLSARGHDWLPQAAAPARRVVVPALLRGSGTRRLTLFAPGRGTTTVDVRVVGAQGEFVPTGGGQVDVDRGRTTTVDLSRALAEDDAAIVVESPVPVVAGARWQTAGTVAEFAYSAGTPPLDSPGVVAGLTVADGARSTLALTAPGRAARVRVQVLVDGVPKGGPRTVEVPAGRTVRTESAKGLKERFALLLTPEPGGGAVYAGVVRAQQVEGFAALTLTPVGPATTTVRVPEAVVDAGVLAPS